MARLRLSRVLVWVAFLALAPPAVGQGSDHDDHAHHLVRITDDRLAPRVVEMHFGDAIAWANYTKKGARISFDRDVAKRIVCEAPGAFVLTDDALESRELRALQFASMCKLTPGEYEYRVNLHGVTPGSDPSKGRKGRILVAD